MRSLLASQRAAIGIKKKINANEELVDDIPKALVLQANTPVNFRLVNANFIIFESEKTFELSVLNEDNSVYKKKSNVFAYSTDERRKRNLLQIKSGEAQTVTIIPFYIDIDEVNERLDKKSGLTIKTVSKTMFVSKESYDAEIGYLFEHTDKIHHHEESGVIFYNPNGAKIKDGFKYDEKLVEIRKEEILNTLYVTAVISDHIKVKDENHEFIETKVCNTVAVPLVGGKGDKKAFNQVFEIKNDMIYENSVDYESEFPPYIIGGESGGLSTGAIVGIVIGSIAGVAIIGFCVYWFVFRKKGDASENESDKNEV